MSDRFARVLNGLAVLAVAVIAAAVSYAHIESLGLAHGYTGATARLLPLSVDGLIVVSSMTLLTEARAPRPAPGLARFGLVLGIAGTLAANVAYGIHYGPVGAVVNAWPAAAFITATEILVGQMRRAGTAPARDATVLTVADVPGVVPVDVPAIEPVTAPASTVPTAPATLPRTVSPRRAPQRVSGRKPKAPEKVFAAEIEANTLPSLRAVKARMNVGTNKARIIRDELAAILRGVPEAA